MSDSPATRVSNADREQVAEVLRTAYADGRITEGELDERLAATYAARFRSDLEPLTVDLPSPAVEPVTPSAVASAGATASGAIGSIIASGRGIFLLAPIICTVIYLMTDPGGYFWPMWVWFGCGTTLALTYLGRR